VVLAVGSSDVVEEDGLSGAIQNTRPDGSGEGPHLDDASSTPHTSNAGVVQIPAKLHEG
jgi:hypothetical protein